MATGEPPETTRIVTELMPKQGTLLDIGVGRGRASLPIAESGYRLIGVDESLEMLTGFSEDARERSMHVETVEGRWPDVATHVPIADVALAANVVYNVADIVPFIGAMIDHDEGRVVSNAEASPGSLPCSSSPTGTHGRTSLRCIETSTISIVRMARRRMIWWP